MEWWWWWRGERGDQEEMVRMSRWRIGEDIGHAWDGKKVVEEQGRCFMGRGTLAQGGAVSGRGEAMSA